MGLLKGGTPRALSFVLLLEPLLCGAVTLGIYAYFIAVQADRHEDIPAWQYVVTALGGAMLLYTIPAILLTCCLGGVTFFAVIGVIFDLVFCAASVANAVLTRDGADKCKHNNHVKTPLGTGSSGSKSGFDGNVTYSVNLGHACRMNKVVFILSIVTSVIWAVLIVVHIWLAKSHKDAKKNSSNVANGYTTGPPYSTWGRQGVAVPSHDAEMGGGLAPPAAVFRASQESGLTGSTVGDEYEVYPNKNASQPSPYYETYPSYNGGTGMNPYSYEGPNHVHPGGATNF